MPADKPASLKVETFPDYQVITQPNPLRGAMRRATEADADDPVARAERALEGLSGEFIDWMASECDRLARAHATVLKQGFTPAVREEFFRAAHDIKGDAATFGYPLAAAAAESLCRLMEHAPDLAKVPLDLVTHHVTSIQAMVREHGRIDRLGMADELSRQLRGLADKFLVEANRDRPEHLEAILAPSIVPGR
ncbi:Hpt domain-containing protein [Bradyrhizobium sp. U87765 SZCCT0131]|uniref:Hpt domain-containing protein n=1 Tax=unclassified Bradyrhizobium TaxID=2631580 RepID=UPI001BAE10B7|nr:MULTISPECIES: Hpt domain-containing protein [unclassified Bradyrhizobium]MBR1222960.1 Hpt domain-containing protein [Bradyrhizobium sp. U87765 SZCCT0131]MBR1262696.1 Hpt domain-containing protein [Bradyrhizobium sp. U87765 SZCCT0134]MBR1308832.1 Hpt domain-containing protein [Bradyrhizobium sp. U87765 SZCCT0110]MBR1318478.1 Hpt domain-containing protein [Bradyrhizobium sp. U87765 SZCCT0109]MBR1352182.1 Hpt domain-containing protein [Bradyrhizobium sp. U87765 SZCCT0048]